MIQAVIDKRIKAVASIDGIGFPVLADKSTWRIDFKPSATLAHRTAAQAVVDAFDIAVEEQKIKNAKLAKEAAHARALTKLRNMGLTQKEVEALYA